MSLLGSFNAPPPPGFVTACERNGELVTVTAEEAVAVGLDYPQFQVSREMLARPNLSKESARMAFIEHNETLWKRTLHAWYEHGIAGVLEEFSNHKQGNMVSKISLRLLALVRWSSSLHGSLFPHLTMSQEDMIAEFSRNLDWRNSPIRVFAWHSTTVKYAVCLQDNSIRVYRQKSDIVPLLKHKLQKGVADLAWRPFSSSILAVACQTCILIWHVDPMSLSTRPSTGSVQVLSHSGHCPITSIAWCPKGGALISASPADTSMMVWDVGLETCVPLCRLGGGGVSLLHWSPDGGKLFAATPSSMFRVWDCQSWTCERWSKLIGQCQTACWSPDSSVLLFATAKEPIIYSLTFGKAVNEKSFVIGGSKMAIASINLEEVVMDLGDETVRFGGQVQSLCWDPTGERLAVHFKENTGSPELVLVFRTKLHPVLEVVPCGFVQGQVGEIPNVISFQPRFAHGAVLTVVWSSGRVSFIPLYFVSERGIHLHNNIYLDNGFSGHGHSKSLYSESLQDFERGTV
ncbi:aladin-like isoform X2 [Lineus longissimus]|uniref:aladin-like isoform X2 n=1 Tax=Lineus longissimus TaxID=88925 RepID=UPI00315D0AF3